MAKKKQPAVQKAYNKELRRIKQFIKRAEKRGYIIPENIIPKRPKRITSRSVESLRKINPEKIYKKSRFVDTETGEILKGLAGRKYERSKAARKAAETRKVKNKAEQDFWTREIESIPFVDDATANEIRGYNVVNEILERLIDIKDSANTTYSTSFGTIRRRRAEVVKAVIDACNQLINLVNQQIKIEGNENIGKKLNPKAEDINYHIDRISYASKSSDVYTAMSALIAIISTSIVNTNLVAASIIDEYEDGLDEL